MNATQTRIFLVLGAMLVCGAAAPTRSRLETDWTDRVGQLFHKQPHKDAWRIQGSEYVDSKGKRLRYVTVLTTPRQTSPRGCKSQAISITLKPGEYLDDLLICQKHPCRQKLWTYAAVLDVKEETSCAGVNVDRYFLLASPIEELALVELHDLAKCIQKNGAKIMDEKVCGVQFTERPERTEDIRRAYGKRYREYLDLITSLRLGLVNVGQRPPGPMPTAYELGFCDPGQFYCDLSTGVYIFFKNREEAEIEVVQTTS